MIRSITIEPVLNGFVLQVGCQKVVFNDTKQLANEIRKYYDDPDATEKFYIESAVNKMTDMLPNAPTMNGLTGSQSWNLDPNPPRYAIVGASQ